MTTDVIYKVLWVDDQNELENGNLPDFYEGWQLKAGNYNIELIPFDNWEEAEYSLRKNFDEYSAIILDANCKIHKNDTEQEEFITAVLPSLTNIFGEKRKLLPWYLLSAGTMSNFSNIVNGARYQHSRHHEDWGTMLYLKDATEGENAPSNLFENIAKVAKDQAMNVVLYRHHDTFNYLGEGKLIDARARKLMLRMLSALYYPEENINFEYAGNPLRKVIEYMFRSAKRQGLLPDECIINDEVKLTWSSKFMDGQNVSYDNTDKSKVVRWGDFNSGKRVFTEEIGQLVKRILRFTQEDSHTDEDEPWYIDEESKDIFFGYVLQMCHVIKWYGQYASKHSDVELNKSMHRRKPEITTTNNGAKGTEIVNPRVTTEAKTTSESSSDIIKSKESITEENDGANTTKENVVKMEVPSNKTVLADSAEKKDIPLEEVEYVIPKTPNVNKQKVNKTITLKDKRRR